MACRQSSRGLSSATAFPSVGAIHESPAIFDTSERANPDSPLQDALAPYLPFIAAVAAADVQAQMAFCRGMNKMIDAVADEINDIAVEAFGDVILEEADGAYAIIEDYREQLSFLWR